MPELHLQSPSPSDSHLLERFQRDRDEAAFTELVRRHLPPILASARRQVGMDRADDVVQAVFLVLARKAASLPPSTVLSAWLFRTTRFVAARARRSELRRYHRELAAASMPAPSASSESAPADLTPDDPALDRHLDDALAALGEADRRFVLARFFERQDFAAVGARFGVSAEAARKRVDRAVERLRVHLARKGVVLGAVVLGTALSGRRAEALPAEWVVSVARAAVHGAGSGAATSSALSLATGALRDWWWTRFGRLAASALLVAFVGGWGLTTLMARWAPAVERAVETSDQGPQVDARTVPVVGSPGDDGSEIVRTREFQLELRDAVTEAPLVDAGIILQVWDERRIIRTEPGRTGSDGVCRLAVRDPDLMLLRFWIAAPGHVPVVADWARYELDQPEVRYVCRLERGMILRGKVLDVAGAPVAGALIQFQEPGLEPGQRENIGFHPELVRVVSDADGRFVSDQMPRAWASSPLEIVVRHPGFARARLSIPDSRAWATPPTIVLEPGVPVRGSVTDADGVPVAAARVKSNVAGGWEEDSVTTDLDGRFEFPHVAAGPFPFIVDAAGYQRHDGFVEAGPATSRVAVRLVPGEGGAVPATSSPPRWMRLGAEVRSAESGQALPRFRVLLREGGGTLRFLGEGRNGAVEWRIDTRYFDRFNLEIEADGFLPAASEIRPSTGSEERFEFRLEPGSGVEGVVRQPDGSPAVGARVALAGWKVGQQSAVMANPGTADSGIRWVGQWRGFLLDGAGFLDGQGAPVRFTLTDAEGRFRVRRSAGDERLQVGHESGSAFLELSAWDGREVRLRGWGSLTGRVLHRGEPLRTKVYLADPGHPANFGCELPVDADGRFECSRVPPGPVIVSAIAPVRGGRLTNTVSVAVGETISVILGGD